MSIVSTIITKIEERTGYTCEFDESSDKRYFIVNGNVTSVYLNTGLFQHLEVLRSHVVDEKCNSVINGITDVYIEALNEYMEK